VELDASSFAASTVYEDVVIQPIASPSNDFTVVVISSLLVAKMILFESSLSYLGLGVPPDTPTWGGMLSDGQVYMATAWWITTFPGLAIMFTALAINIVGDWLRDQLDPRLSGGRA